VENLNLVKHQAKMQIV